MGWETVIYLIIALVVSVALAPKPPKPKAAALDDFDFPTAEEGRPIPVVFGTVRITGPNILWYGDLGTKAIKKKSMFSSTTIGYKYFMGLHFGVCHGPVDALTKIEAGEKTAWSGSVTTNSSITISQGELFGGKKREGGLVGTVDVCMGGAAQAANTYLDSAIGYPLGGPAVLGDLPAFRGILGLVWRGSGSGGLFSFLRYDQGGYIGTTPYAKPWAFTVKRITSGWQGGTVWYSAKAAIGSAMNGAHIVYQTLTDPEWGMGLPADKLDEASFTAAADLLYAENFGLSLLWNQQATIEDFLAEVLNHVAGVLAFDRSTGKYRLTLLRGNYDAGALPAYGPETLSAVTSFQRQAWGETVNELTLGYTDPATLKSTSVTVHDLANVRAQGVRVATGLTYPGIVSATIAQEVAMRELAARSTPLAKITFRVNRDLWQTKNADVVKITWPVLGIENLIVRVLKVRQGTLGNGELEVEGVEDVFALSLTTYTAQPGADGGEDGPGFDEEEQQEGPAVISATTTAPPGTPADGDTYLVPTGASGAWAGHAGESATWDADADAWIFTTPAPGTVVTVTSTGTQVQTVAGGTATSYTPIQTTGKVVFGTSITPTALAADVNDYAPTDLATASGMRLSATGAARTITGLTGGEGGRIMLVHNVGTLDLVLKDESASSTAANRFALNADVTLKADQSTLLQYDAASSRWRVIGGTGSGITSSQSFPFGLATTAVTLTDGATITIDATLSNVFQVTLGGNRTFAAPTTPLNAQTVNVLIRQDATGSRTITWDAAFTWPGGVVPTLSSAANAVDLLSMQYDPPAAKWRAVLLSGFAASGGSGGTGVTDGDKGDITVSSGGATWTIDAGVVTLAKMANIATATIIGRSTAGTGVPEALTGTQATALLDTFTSGAKGLAPASGGGTTNYLRADGAWAAPAGGGGGSGGTIAPVDKGASVRRDSALSVTGGVWTTLPFTVEEKDDANYWNVSNPERFTAPESGWYAMTAMVQWDGNNYGHAFAFSKNNTVNGGGAEIASVYEAANGNARQNIAWVGFLAAGEYVTVNVFSNSTANVVASHPARAAIHRLGVGASPGNPLNDGAYVFRNANAQSIPHNTVTAITFDTEVRDDNAYADLVTNSDRLVARAAGWYAVTGWVSFPPSGTGFRNLWIYKNGLPNADRYGWVVAPGSAANSTRLQTSALVYLAAGDYVQMAVVQDSGGALSLDIGNALQSFAMHRLGVADDRRALEFFDDFLTGGDWVTTGQGGTEPWFYTEAGGSQVTLSGLAEGGKVGIVKGRSGTNAGGLLKFARDQAVLSNLRAQMMLSATYKTCFEFSVKYSHATCANSASMSLGPMDDLTNYQNCVWVEIASAGLRLNCKAANVQTTANATTNVVAGSWHRIRCEVTTAKAELFLDDALVATITTNIPTAAMSLMGQVYAGTVGGTDYSMSIDWLRIWTEDPTRYISATGRIDRIPPISPDAFLPAPNVLNDEFESALLSPDWATRNFGSATATLSQGALRLKGAATNTSTRGMQIIEKVLAAGDFKFRAKFQVGHPVAFNNGGFALVENATQKCLRFGVGYGFVSGNNPVWQVESYLNPTTFTSQPYASGTLNSVSPTGIVPFFYYEIERIGSTIYTRVSDTGHDDTFVNLYSFAQTAHFTTAPDRIGLYVESLNATQAVLVCDWFRRVA